MFMGIMFAFSLGGLTWAMKDLSQQMLFDQYEKVQTYNLKVDFTRPLDMYKVSGELSRFPGVKWVETMAEIPLTLKNKWYEKNVVLLGLPQNSSLYNILDKEYNRVEPPQNGILISERLADILKAEKGTQLTVESVMMKDPGEKKTLEVVGIIPQYLGLNAYMEIEAANRFLGQKNVATSAMLCINDNSIPELYEKYKDSVLINSISNRTEMYNQVKELMASFSGTIYVFAIMAIITGFAIIYNSSTITLSERSRELASMRVLGMTPAEVLSVITFEQWFISIFAMIAGIPLTKLLLLGMGQTMNNDIYTMPTHMSAFSVVIAFFITAVSIFIAQRMAAKKIKDLSLVDVLKSSE